MKIKKIVGMEFVTSIIAQSVSNISIFSINFIGGIAAAAASRSISSTFRRVH